MTSIRKAKKRLKASQRMLKDIDESIFGSVDDWINGVTKPLLRNITLLHKIRKHNKRFERKLRKQGKWEEYVEFREHLKRQQATLLPPWMLGLGYPPTDGKCMERFKEYLKQRQ